MIRRKLNIIGNYTLYFTIIEFIGLGSWLIITNKDIYMGLIAYLTCAFIALTMMLIELRNKVTSIEIEKRK